MGLNTFDLAIQKKMAACNDAAIGMDFRRAAASTAWIARVG